MSINQLPGYGLYKIPPRRRAFCTSEMRKKIAATYRRRAEARFDAVDHALRIGLDLYGALADAGWNSARSAERVYMRYGRRRPAGLSSAARRERCAAEKQVGVA